MVELGYEIGLFIFRLSGVAVLLYYPVRDVSPSLVLLVTSVLFRFGFCALCASAARSGYSYLLPFRALYVII
jgi:hypothetical protein